MAPALRNSPPTSTGVSWLARSYGGETFAGLGYHLRFVKAGLGPATYALAGAAERTGMGDRTKCTKCGHDSKVCALCKLALQGPY
jgi:hypothetical protein